MRFKHKSAVAYLSVWDDGTATLSSLYSKEKRLGHASELMGKICKYADDNHIKITLLAKPFALDCEPILDYDTLEAFYVSYGFKVRGEPSDFQGVMVRHPSQEKPGL